MTPTRILLAIIILALTPAFADPPDLAFRPGGKGLFLFDTGTLKGRLKLDGKYQGLYPLVDVATGDELTRPPGVFSFYRVFETNRRYGNAARDWPTVTKLLSDGAVEVRWPSAKTHPLEITAIYRWTSADSLDLETTVKPHKEMPKFELFMSSYFVKGFRASVYLKPPDKVEGDPSFVPADRKPGGPGGYVMFPRDKEAIATIRDGRWKIPPSPVNWAIERWLEAPLAMRRDQTRGLTALMMCGPQDCFAVSSPWNAPSLEAGGYRSLYLSLFGQDLKAGQVARAHCRLVIGRKMSDEQALQRYEAYLKEFQRQKKASIQ